ncbi:MAG: MMPL family transporter [Alphaproteobacteria bacterium]|nr:MMPL family transporter [Alphaproteobacteria bacterium]
MQAITRFFVERWQFTLVMFGLLIALGAAAIVAIPKSEDPITRFPFVGVVVVLPGADAEQMERLVAIPLEQAMNGIEDVVAINSSSRAGVTSLGIEFVYGVDPERKFDEVVRELNVVRPNLPDGVTLARADRRNPAQANVVQMALVSEDASFRQMESYARGLRDAIERAPGVQQAEIWGAPPTEVRVSADIDRLAAYRLPLTAVADALRREGADVPIGAVEAGGRRLNVEATGGFDSLEEIRRVVLRVADGVIVTVGDVSDVAWANDQRAHITRYNGQRAVIVTARAKLGETVFDVIRGVRGEVDDFAERLPENITLERGFDQAETVAHRLSTLGRDFCIAILLVLVTLLPLGFRASLVVMMSIPLSLAIGVFALNMLGYSLNQLSIAGFVLALGLLVDDSIVVTENISRRLREGLPPRDAAIAGVSEINIAVIGCTATLLLAFVPLMALPEAAGDFIRSLPVAVVVTITASLVVSLTIIPFLASRMLPKSAAGKSNAVLDAVMGAIHTFYRPALHVALQRPLLTVIVGLAVSIASLGLIPRLGFSLFPENDSPYFMVDVELPEGAAISETDKAVRHADAVLGAHEEIGWRFANSGRGNPQVYYNLFPEEQRSNIGQIYARFEHWEAGDGHALLERIRDELNVFPGAKFTVRRFENGPPIEAPIAVRIRGADLAALGEIAGAVERIVLETPGTRDVSNPLAARLVDLDMNIDIAAASLRGVPPGAVDDALRIAVGGATVASYRDPVGDAYPIVLRAPRDDALPASALQRLFVWTESGAAAPLSEVADPRFTSGPARIDRYKRERTVTVEAYTQPGYLTSRVTADVAGRLAAIDLPPGYAIEFGGQAEAQSESFGGLGPAIMIAMFGIIAVLLLEFKSFAASAVVAFVIPFGVMGGLIALFLAGQSLSFTAVIGFVALIGIEIKNSILLVEFANQERARGATLKDAIEKAGEVRFLPVLLTSLTAIGGLTPLVLENSPLYSPLALVIIGGLVSSTLVARIVTPAMYLLLAPKDGEADAAAPAAAPAE